MEQHWSQSRVCGGVHIGYSSVRLAGAPAACARRRRRAVGRRAVSLRWPSYLTRRIADGPECVMAAMRPVEEEDPLLAASATNFDIWTHLRSEIRNASDKSSDNAARQRQTQRDAARQRNPSDLR